MGHAQHRRQLRPGDRISVPLLIFWTHVGVFVGYFNGVPIVVSLSDVGYREQPLKEFIGGGRFWVELYNGQLHSWELLRNARWTNYHRYDAGNWNCEHFACAVQGRKPESKQAAVTGAVAFAGFAALVLAGLSKA
jgi:hypothetical protein